MPHGDMALRCGLNTWSVHAVLEHAACTPRPVYHACKPGSVHATCTLAALYTWPVHSALVHVACRQSVKFIYTRSVYRQHCRRVQAGVVAEVGSTNTSPKDIIPSMGDAVVQFQADVFAQVNNTNTSPHKKTMKRKAISQHRKLSAVRVSKSQGCQNPKAVKFLATNHS